MKKLIQFILVMLFCLNFVACTKENNEDETNQENPVVDEVKGEISTIREQKLYEDDQMVVSLKESSVGFVDNMVSFPLNLTIQNKTNHELTVVSDFVVINDIVVEQFNLFNITIEANGSIDYAWLFEEYMYTRNQFSTIASISFRLIKYEAINGDYAVSRTNTIKIETDHADYKHTINGEGEVLIDENGFKIVAQEAELIDAGQKEYYCWFYVENNTDEDVMFQIEKMSVNGFVIKTSTMPRTPVPSNTKGYISLLFTQEDIIEYKLDPIDRMYVELAVLEDLDAHTYGEELVKNRSIAVYYVTIHREIVTEKSCQ